MKQGLNGRSIGGCIGSAQDTLLKRGQTAFLEVPSMLEWFDQDDGGGMVR